MPQPVPIMPFDGGDHGGEMILRPKYSVKELGMMAAMRSSPNDRVPPKLAGCARRTIDGGVQSLADLVAEYIKTHRTGCQRDRDRFRRLPSLPDAVAEAAGSARADGKRESHQCRIPKHSLDQFAAAILEQPLANARDFDDLHAYVRRAAKRVHGIGELAIYDVALRIGWFGRMEPTRVYLHAGTREGARALGLDVSGASLARAVFPAAMQELSAAEIEDFMCIYKAQLGRFRVRRDATSA
jgi:hypothetical protein